MYSPAEFAPLSPASMKKLLKGHTVRVKYGSGLKLNLSKAQLKKHASGKKKGQGGYNLTMDPYQCEMHGMGFFEDVGKAFKKTILEPAKKEATKQGRKVASKLIHEGIPIAGEVLGGLAGSLLGAEAGSPEMGEMAGQQLGAYGGKKLANYVGQKTGLGMKKLTPAMMKKLSQPRLLGGTALIDQPFTARQAVDTSGRFIKDPAKTLGFGMQGGTALIDQPFTARQAVDTTGRFIKDPAKTVGFGMRGRPRKGGALHQAGY